MTAIDGTTQIILDFLVRIGLEVRREDIDGSTVLPGVTVDRGVLILDAGRLTSPGDLLHEAGHLAVLGSADRATAATDLGSDGGYEMAAIAWSWAAVNELGLEPGIVFHEHGYRGGSVALVENFDAGRYIGVPVLEWLGLTAQDERAVRLGVEPFPAMMRWLAE